MAASDTKENNPQDEKNFQNPDKGNKADQKTASTTAHPITDNAGPDYADDLGTDENSNKYDSENPRNEPGPRSKDITEKEIENDLMENDPSGGFETDIDTQNSDEAESDSFEIIEPDQDNPVQREFEIGQLGNKELREDEMTRDATDGGAPGNYKPSQRKF
ncbi:MULTISPECIES: hypothetical protein [Flavobacterium]|uniref:hypothetical protein n=1 Tax=Flavobacterium TaxID=237 RepID=UPI002115933C|nr:MULTISPECIES: hypothetical protein [Flavobacterium]UUF12560.1 hypothetical protein NLJ00_14995 [Flavobacterium panici]